MKKILFVLFFLLPAAVRAGVVLDAHWFMWVSSEPPLNLGGESEQKFAQTFEARHNGVLDRVELVVGCSDDSVGNVTVEIQKVGGDGLPDGTVIGGVTVMSSSLAADEPTIQAFRIPGVRLTAGIDYAVVIRADTSVSCFMAEGASFVGPDYPDGSGYFDARPNPPGWISLASVGRFDDHAFWIYVVVPEPTEPRHCDFETADGVPNDWVPADVPVCACLSDPGLPYHGCWFAFPDWFVWRQIPVPFDQAGGKAEWQVLPMNADFPGLLIQELDPNGQAFSEPVLFDPGLKPGKITKEKVLYQGAPKGTLVKFEFELDGEPASVVFETLLDIPPNGQQPQ